MRKYLLCFISIWFIYSDLVAQEKSKPVYSQNFLGFSASSVAGVGLSYLNSNRLSDIRFTTILPLVNLNNVVFFNSGLSLATHLRNFENGYFYGSVNGTMWLNNGRLSYSTGVILGCFYNVPNTDLKFIIGGGYGFYATRRFFSLSMAGEIGLFYNINSFVSKEKINQK